MNSSFIDEYEIKEQYGAKWLKLVYHNCANNVFFTRENVFYITNNNQIYSILKLLNYVDKYENDKYEFLLEYPELGYIYNRWRQKSNKI